MDISITKSPEYARVDLERWAKIVIEKWEFNILKYNLIYSGTLLRSFEAFVNQESGGDRALVSFVFEYYLRMLEMGAGKGTTDNRKRYPVFTKTFYAELHRLTDLLSNMYAENGAKIIALGITN